jgi:hypothetical protein
VINKRPSPRATRQTLDEPELASYLTIGERELEAGGQREGGARKRVYAALVPAALYANAPICSV